METRKKKSFKRLFAFLMAFVMVASLAVSAVFAAEPTFKDVPKDYEFYDEIEDLAAKDIIGGFGTTGLFKPEEKLTRAQAAKMIAKAAGIKVSKGFKTSFTDVDEDVDMYEHIWALEELEIVKGWANTKEFRPDEAIERGHVAKMIALAFGIADGSTKVEFKDLPADKEVADYIMALATNDIVKGYGATGEFRPEEPVLRGQFAKMVSRAMNLKFEILEVRAINAKTVEATFNKEPSALALKDFSVYEKDDESAINVIAKLAKKGAVATLTLTNALEEDTDYILDVDGVGQAEFTYEEAEAASIAFVATTVQVGKDVLYVIKDAAGNDITSNYSLTDLTVQTSDPLVVSTALKAGGTAGNAIVNVIITDTEIETGNTIIKVQESLQVLTSVGKWTLSDSGTFAKPVTELFKKDKDEAIIAQALDQSGETIDTGIVFSFVSKDPGVLVVDATSGVVTPIAVGTANVVITAKQGTTKTVSKTVQIKVKADPVATTLNVTPASVQMALGTTVATPVKVEVLDQYGKPFGVGTTVTAKTSKAGLAYNATSADLNDGKTFVLDADGEATIALYPDTATATSGKLTVTYETLTKKEVAVSVVTAGDFAGYVVETPDGLKLDLNADDEDLAEGPTSSVIEVYEIDTKGNKIQAASFTLERVDLEGKAPEKQPVTVSSATATVTAQAVGTQSVRVKVGGTVQKTLSFTVVNTTPVLDNVKVAKSAVSVLTTESDLIKVLFGTGDDGKGALVGYDQYGEKIAVTAADYTLTSSDLTVVDNDGKVGIAGTAKLTIVFADLEQIHFVNVVVK